MVVYHESTLTLMENKQLQQQLYKPNYNKGIEVKIQKKIQ